MGVRRTWHHDVQDIAKARGISVGEARKLYKSGVRPGVPSEGQEVIAGAKAPATPAALVEMATSLLSAAGSKEKADSVLSFVSEIQS